MKKMKKYVKPATRTVSVSTEVTMLLECSGQKVTGGTKEKWPPMGHDGELWEGL